MAEGAYEQAVRVWRSRELPVLVKPLEGKLKVRFPTDEIRWPFQIKPKHHAPVLLPTKKYWELPRARFNELILTLLNSWHAAHVIQYFREQKKCAPPCRSATGFDCECACGGEFHGLDGPHGEWIDITDTFSVKRGDTYLSCRLIKKRTS